MVSDLLDAKSLPEPAPFCQLSKLSIGPLGTKFDEFESKYEASLSSNVFEYVVDKMSALCFRPDYVDIWAPSQYKDRLSQL